MKGWNNILRPVVSVIALLIMALHVLPTSFHFLESEICVNINITDSESEEKEKEKEKEKELFERSGSNDMYGALKVSSFMDHCTALPTPPFLETLSPPPDFV